MAAVPHIMLLNSGGLRSLLALSMAMHRHDKVRLTLIHAADGRDASAQRLEYAHRQADYHQLSRVVELNLTHLYHHPTAHTPDGLPASTLATPQLLLAALGYAADHKADQLIWPVAHNARPTPIGRATEQRIVCRQLAETELDESTALQTPLLRYTDRQLIELGEGLGIPWELSWSCALDVQRPCGGCPACRRRSTAFREAGVMDRHIDDAAVPR